MVISWFNDSEGSVYNVHYTDKDGNVFVVSYFGYCESDARRLFNSERYEGEEIIKIVKGD